MISVSDVGREDMIDMRVKMLFFDSPALRAAMDGATRQALGRAGAYIRRRAKSSICKRKGIARPGDAPTAAAIDIGAGQPFVGRCGIGGAPVCSPRARLC